MKFLTHCLALGALLILHSPAGAIVADTHIEQDEYTMADFPSVELRISTETCPEPDVESEVFVATLFATVHGSGAEKPGDLARKPATDYG